MKVAVVGGGIFGCTSALALARAGHDVTLYESHGLLRGASKNNHARLHLGFHYPRDLTTAKQCLRGYLRFLSEFPNCVAFDHPAHYYIAQEGSHTTPEQYLAFLNAAGIPYKQVPVDDRVRGCELAVRAWEAVYDAEALANELSLRLSKAGVPIVWDRVQEIKQSASDFQLVGVGGYKTTADVVVNCAYQDQNRLTAQLGLIAPRRQYEYTIVPIVEIPDFDRQAITIMDGPFCSIQPYGFSKQFLLYHAQHAVQATSVGAFCPPEWKPLERSQLQDAAVAARETSRKILEASVKYIPALSTASLHGFLHGPRVVLADVDVSDARPSFVQEHVWLKGDRSGICTGYLTVFAGKVDHACEIADEVVNIVSGYGKVK